MFVFEYYNISSKANVGATIGRPFELRLQIKFVEPMFTNIITNMIDKIKSVM